jgi:hypothetical protein
MLSKEGLMIRWNILAAVGIVAVVGFVSLASVYAQQKTSKSAGFTTQDYIDIQQLVARYPYAFDGGLAKGAAYADLFTPDGVFINQDGRHEGRTELQRMGGSTRRRETPLNVAHYIVNHVITPISSSRATGTEYLVVLNIAEDGESVHSRSGSIRLGGQYRDEYEKTPQGWRFKVRQYLNKDATETAEATAEKLRSQVYQPPAPGQGPGRSAR